MNKLHGGDSLLRCRAVEEDVYRGAAFCKRFSRPQGRAILGEDADPKASLGIGQFDERVGDSASGLRELVLLGEHLIELGLGAKAKVADSVELILDPIRDDLDAICVVDRVIGGLPDRLLLGEHCDLALKLVGAVGEQLALIGGETAERLPIDDLLAELEDIGATLEQTVGLMRSLGNLCRLT